MGNQNNVAGTAPDELQGKTFTQEQVNAIVGKRLAEQKAALEAEFVKKEQELNKREMGIRAKELLAEKGLPKDLSDILRYDSEEELIKAIDTIEHTRGFKNNKDSGQAQAGGSSGKYRVLGDNRLPESKQDVSSDPIAAAFKLQTEG